MHKYTLRPDGSKAKEMHPIYLYDENWIFIFASLQ